MPFVSRIKQGTPMNIYDLMLKYMSTNQLRTLIAIVATFLWCLIVKFLTYPLAGQV